MVITIQLDFAISFIDILLQIDICCHKENGRRK
jgi:hypothetical protein